MTSHQDIKREPVKVLPGYSAIGGDIPATCVPMRGGPPSYGYMSAEHAAMFNDLTPLHFFAEWNGVSFDLIEPMTEADIEIERATAQDIPF